MEQKTTEITRSASRKLNLGNYETKDFFASRKAECLEKDAERVSEELHQFCEGEIAKSIAEYEAETRIEKQKKDKKIDLLIQRGQELGQGE